MPLALTLTQAGTYTIMDNGVPGDGMSLLRQPDGTVQLFAHPIDELIITAATPGVHLILDFADSLLSAKLTVGSLTDAALNPDSIVVKHVDTSDLVTLAAGTIGEGGADAAADIIADSVVLSATAGIGTAANPIEMDLSFNLEAETTTGGIYLTNFGTTFVGAITDEVAGLDVLTSGDIVLTAYGSIVLVDSTSGEIVHGGNESGNITLIADGADSDVTASVDTWAAVARRGSVAVEAGRDILLGTAGDFENDVSASGSLTLTAGRDVIVDGSTRIVSDDWLQATGGDLVITAGRDIGFLSNNGSNVLIAAEGVFNASADIVLTTGRGGTLTLDVPDPAALWSVTGEVVVNADRIVIDSASGITAADGVTLGPSTAGGAIFLGSFGNGTNGIELSDTELDRIFAPVLTIGRADAGQIAAIGAVSPAGADNVLLWSGTDILLENSLTATASLTAWAGDDFSLYAAGAITTGTLAILVDTAADDEGIGGVAILDGTVAATASATITGGIEADTLDGGSAGESLFGERGDDVLNGHRGDDILDGGAGVDAMTGGRGDDTYLVDDAGDSIVELAGQGDDVAMASVGYVLAAGAAVETLTTTLASGTDAIDLTGNGFAQSITGNAGANRLSGGDGNDDLHGLDGNDVLVGGVGADVVEGGAGNDVYRIDDAVDLVVELQGEGDDRIAASVSFTLAAGVEVETVGTINESATTAINLTGNELGQGVFGNAGVNTLTGADGDDVLRGLGGNDVLVGGAGVDTLEGGAGNDVFRIDDALDTIVEAVGEGDDRVAASVSYTLNAGAQVEIVGTINEAAVTAIDLTGNELAQSLFGNAGVNALSGAGGADTLNGGLGNDTLNGGADADTCQFTSLGAANADTIVGFVSGTDRIVLDDAAFAGLPAGALDPNAFRIGTAAADADDRIIYNSATGALFFDADGNGAGAMVHFATLQGQSAIAATDFMVI